MGVSTDFENAETAQSLDADSVEGSVDTVCKDFDSERQHDRCLMASQMSNMPADFATFFQQSGIQRIVRANHDWEPGMKKRSYPSKIFLQHGIAHENIRVMDTHGGL